jgi:hypothetical protein
MASNEELQDREVPATNNTDGMVRRMRPLEKFGGGMASAITVIGGAANAAGADAAADMHMTDRIAPAVAMLRPTVAYTIPDFRLIRQDGNSVDPEQEALTSTTASFGTRPTCMPRAESA